MSDTVTELAPVSGRARIDVIDILRGIAILGIFFMNIPFMGQNGWLQENDIRSIGWTAADQTSWATIEILAEGTQRGLLEMLFGAGLMVLASRAMAPDGPVAVADLYIRRNLWLLLFGLVDVFVLGWPGDILHIYALAALALFPFRLLGTRWLIALGLAYAAFMAVGGTIEYANRTALIAQVESVKVKQAEGTQLTATDTAAQAEWTKKIGQFALDKEEQKRAAAEAKSHLPGTAPIDYLFQQWDTWMAIIGKGVLLYNIPEAFCAMLIGIALWKWQFIQGGRTATFYLVSMISAYGFGLTARGVGVWEIFHFAPIAKTSWITHEFARLSVTVGHIALINLAMMSGVGARIFGIFKAPGRMAFSLYFMQQIIGIWILFAPFGFGLWGKYSYAGLAAIAAGVIIVQIVFANFWIRFFVTGPLEWAWRSLSYLRWQPFRRVAAA